MVLFEIMLSQNLIQYTPKHTKLHHFKKFSRGGGGHAPEPCHATCKFPNLKKKILGTLPSQILATP